MQPKWLTVVLATVLLTSNALAQSNSLFRRGQGRPAPNLLSPPAPTSQPANLRLPGLPPGPAVRQAPIWQAPPPVLAPTSDPQLNPNPALLAMSPIAVPSPEKEKLRPGALVTIIVRESKQAVTDANLRSQKQWDLEAELLRWFRIGGEQAVAPAAFPQGLPGAEIGVQDNYQGRGRVDRRDELITRITATVIDVKPNGTLILEARKSIALDEETQVYTLTGKCRTEDLTPQNTILSTQVADLDVSVQHTGAARDASRRSIWKRLSDLFRLS